MSKSLRTLYKQKPKTLFTIRRRAKHGTITTYVGFMEQVEADCNRYCHIPRVPRQKVTVVGAGGTVGRIVSLFLKQPKVIKTLCLYDTVPAHGVIGMATDLSHIDTSTEVEAYQGRVNLKKALKNAEVVVICGGAALQPPCCATEEELFHINMSQVRSTALACSRFCPDAFVAVAVPPVDCTFSMVAHLLQKMGTLNRRRVIGVNSIASMRATSLMGSLTGQDPAKAIVPVVCGCSRQTIVPVFSASKTNFPQGQMDVLVKLVREADEIICKVKGDGGQAHLSTGFSIARCVYCIMTGLFEKPTFIDSAMVWQDKPSMSYGLEMCASTVTVGPPGIVQFGIPQLNAHEQKLLQDSTPHLKDRIGLGRYHATGEEFERCIRDQDKDGKHSEQKA